MYNLKRMVLFIHSFGNLSYRGFNDITKVIGLTESPSWWQNFFDLWEMHLYISRNFFLC